MSLRIFCSFSSWPLPVPLPFRSDTGCVGLPSTVTWDSFVLLGVELLFPEPSLLPFSWFIPLIWGAHFPVVSLEWCLGGKSLERTCLSANVFAPISRASCFARYAVVFPRKVESETPSSSASNAPAEASDDFPGGKPSVCDSLPPDLLDCFSSRTLKAQSALVPSSGCGPFNPALLSCSPQIFLCYFFYNFFLFLNLLVSSKMTSVFLTLTSGSSGGISEQRGAREVCILPSQKWKLS